MLSYFSTEYMPLIDAGVSLILIALIIILSIKQKLSGKVIVVTCITMFLFVISSIFDLQIVRSIAFVFVALCTVYAALLLTKPEKELQLRRKKMH